MIKTLWKLKNKMAAISKIGKFDFSIFETKYSHAVHQIKAYNE